MIVRAARQPAWRGRRQHRLHLAVPEPSVDKRRARDESAEGSRHLADRRPIRPPQSSVPISPGPFAETK